MGEILETSLWPQASGTTLVGWELGYFPDQSGAFQPLVVFLASN